MKKVKIVLTAALFLGFVVCGVFSVNAQDMKMATPPAAVTTDTMIVPTAEVAMDGNCPICLAVGMPMAGNDEFTAEYEGKAYKFESQEHKDAFVADPGKYVKTETEDAAEAAPAAAPAPAPKSAY